MVRSDLICAAGAGARHTAAQDLQSKGPLSAAQPSGLNTPVSQEHLRWRCQRHAGGTPESPFDAAIWANTEMDSQHCSLVMRRSCRAAESATTSACNHRHRQGWFDLDTDGAWYVPSTVHLIGYRAVLPPAHLARTSRS
jgi:hypothetical protein